MKKINITISQENDDLLKILGSGNISKGIEYVLFFYKRFEDFADHFPGDDVASCYEDTRKAFIRKKND